MKQEHADTKIGEVCVQNVLGGMRGIKGMLTQTSALDPQEGITFRGFTIDDIELTFPKKDHQPLPEGILHLLLTGEKPSQDDVKKLSRELYDRGQTVSQEALDLIRALPKETHPMTALSIGLMACQTQSHFFKAYQEGVHKSEYWLATYEDALDLIAKIPVLAGMVYSWKYRDGSLPSMDPELDWAANYARLMGYDDELFDELMRLYMFLHCDHEGGNVSAHTTHLVGSALSDPYISYAAGVNGLAGPLHGSANSECLKFLHSIQAKYGELPYPAEVAQFVKDTLASGRVVPGYGHAVLKHTDPRFTSQKKFADAFLPNDPICRLVDICYEEIPSILQATGKVSNPWPNVDSHSGALLQHFGLNQLDYFTVLFAVSRSIGCMSNLVLDRYFGLPIERPKSLTYEQLEKLVLAAE